MTNNNQLPRGPLLENPGPAPYPARAAMTGTYVTLRPLDAQQDGAALYAISHAPADDGGLWTYMGYGPFADATAMTTWLTQQETQQDPLFFTVVGRDDDRVMGLVSFLSIVPAMQRLEIGHIWYGPAFQRTEANTESAYLLMRTAFDELGYRRVEWKCDLLNANSRSAALRLGFRPEGIFRKHYIVKGRSRDTIWFSVVDDEWPEVRDNLETWLNAPDAKPSLTTLTRGRQGAAFGQLRS
ncbi:MAG: GNAT family N-acetyltransferase [Caldilineaceae bacterium]|nr:GNAT family N-acetyltransferase [Caldilineaceae bacterium]